MEGGHSEVKTGSIWLQRMGEFRAEWEDILQKHLVDYRIQMDAEIQAKKSAVEESQDLGSRYNLPWLNQTVREAEGGEDTALFVLHENDGKLEFECTACHVKTFGVKTIQQHVNGKKHKNILADLTVTEGSGAQANPDTVPEAEILPSCGLLSKLLAALANTKGSSIGVIGQGWVAEVLVGRGEPDYQCLLCPDTGTLSVRQVGPHLAGAKHQLEYLAHARPEAYLQFAARAKPSLWEQDTFDALDAEVAKLTSSQAEPVMVASPLVFEDKKEEILARIEAASQIN